MKLRHVFLPCIAAISLTAAAVPAKKAYFTYTQPDGSTVTAMPVGDEFGHYYLSTDGKPMLADAEGRLCYASADAAGNLHISKFVATEPALRSAAASEFVSKADASSVADAIELQAVQLRKQRAELRQSLSTRRKAPAKDTDAPQYGLGLYTDDYPSTGEVKSLVFLVEYQDLRFTTPDTHNFYDRQLNEEGFTGNGATGSARDYFLEQSGGKFKPHFDVYGPVLLPENMAYYGGNDFRGNDRNAADMIKHAAAILADEVDFSQYDLDNNGLVDNIYVIYAGYGENNGGSSSSVWPHSHNITDGPLYNGKRIQSYACSNEISDGQPDGIGTFCHEYSHVLGLPDLYSTASQLTCTPSAWNIMDSGSYNNDSRTPANYSSFERNALGWMKPEIVNGPINGRLEEIGKSNSAYLIPTTRTNEFYLLENRQNVGWDEYLPGHGMLIWHIDFNKSVWTANTVNNTQRHQYVDIVEANGMAGAAKSTQAKYPFPGPTGKTEFTAKTTPAMIDWSGYESEFPVTEIAESADSIITFKIAGGVIEFGKPEAPVMSADSKGIIAIEWKALAEVTSYELCVYTRDTDGKEKQLADYRDFSVGDTLRYEIEGIQAETEYFARVRGRNGAFYSEYSDEGSVITPALDFICTAPAADGGSFTDGTAILSWTPLAGAEKYLVTVEQEKETGEETVTVGFGEEHDILAIPEGWNWNERLSDCYGSTGYYGAAAPSVKFPNDQSALETCEFDKEIKGLSFWFRTASSSARSKFHILGRAKADAPYDTIMTIDQLNTFNAGGRILSVPSMPEGIHQVRFVYERYSGFAVIDDISLVFPTYTLEPLVERADAGNALSYIIAVPEGTSGVSFYVEGVDGSGNISRRSNRVIVHKNDQSGISAPGISLSSISVDRNNVSYTGEPGSTVTIYTSAGIVADILTADASGNAATSLMPGFYIVLTTEGSVKIAVK